MDRMVFATAVSAPYQLPGARLLLDSLRAFGGSYADSPVWVYEANPEIAPCASVAAPGIEVLTCTPPDALRNYWFGGKVTACAQAEARATDGFNVLVWMAPDCLVVQPPDLLALDADDGEARQADVAVRPVHHHNVGPRASAPLDAYWRRVYDELGITDIDLVTRTFVGDLPMRAYFNTHALAVRPSLGLCREWLDAFASLAADNDFQAGACSDVQHKVFLHQAPFSPLVATRVPRERLRILPPSYSYPYNLHDDVPPNRRPAKLNELVTIACEDRSMHPDDLVGIAVEGPLRSWLGEKLSPQA